MNSLVTRALIIFGVYLTLLLLAFNTSQAAQISGHLTRNNSDFYIKNPQSKKISKLLSANEEISTALSKLKNGDFIMGSGDINDQSILLQSIDFVGLQSLLGTWLSDKASYLKFKDYTTLVIHTSTVIKPLSYAVTPGSENIWKIYFTDDDSVVLGTLSIESKNRAHLVIYNEDPDASATELTLQKITYK